MPRRPVAIAQIKLRICESLRRKLETEAKRHRISLNTEMHSRLEQSFYDKAHGDIWEIARTLKDNCLRLYATQELLARGIHVEELQRGGSQEEVAERVEVLVAGPVQKWSGIPSSPSTGPGRAAGAGREADMSGSIRSRAKARGRSNSMLALTPRPVSARPCTDSQGHEKTG